ncbi:Protein of unknown function [Nitrosospira briensis]|uniref:DUF1207 domain-containing protein n=1 Tax=Nitrosospira briensis TaxID=35799 RepID=A0A1I5A6V2_9PROT|nr:Protein of unknown function [Nitrosospira briensis]
MPIYKLQTNKKSKNYTSSITILKKGNTVRHLSIIAAALFFTSTGHAAVTEDAYIAGYAAGILKHGFKVEIPTLIVREGVITVPANKLTPDNRVSIVQALAQIPGVTAVTVSDSIAGGPTERDAFAPIQRPGASAREPGPGSEEAVASEGVPAAGPAVLETGMLPKGHLFKPLLADPRWAHFSAAYRNYVGNNIDGNNNGAVSFGETIPFYRGNFGNSTVQWEAGLQAAVFSDFNLGAPSADLINSDFIASAYGSMRAGNFSAFGRVYHQSSHLGDEFLLRRLTSLERINLSYEGADLRLSYELPYGLRVYGGGGGIFHKEPSTIKPWSIQYGVEFRSPWRIEVVSLRPIAAVDIKNHEQNDWNADVSARAGVQLDHFQTFGRKLLFLVEYFHGNSPTGQFFRQRVDYLGIGAHYHF